MDTTNADAGPKTNSAQHGLLPIFCMAVIWSQPVFTYAYYHHMRDSGAYRWDADSVAMPIFSNGILWCVWGPLSLLFLARRFRSAVPPLRLFEWNGARPVFSFLISVGAAALIFLLLTEIPHDLYWQNRRDLGYMGCWIVFWLIVRSLLLANRGVAEARADDLKTDGGPG